MDPEMCLIKAKNPITLQRKLEELSWSHKNDVRLAVAGNDSTTDYTLKHMLRSENGAAIKSEVLANLKRKEKKPA